MLDYVIYRLGDSETVSSTNTSFSATNMAFANMYYVLATGSVNVADATSYGATMQFNRAGPSLRIQVNPITSSWTHTLVGTYLMTVGYRQNTGSDLWTVLAVTKAGTINAVGVSVRIGSGNSGMVDFRIVYYVDSTTAAYQLQQWATGVKTVCGGTGCFSGGPPQWTNFDTLSGGLTGCVVHIASVQSRWLFVALTFVACAS